MCLTVNTFLKDNFNYVIYHLSTLHYDLILYVSLFNDNDAERDGL